MKTGARNRRAVRKNLNPAIKFTISMPARLAEAAIKRQGDLCYSTFSDYLQHATRRDLGIIPQEAQAPKQLEIGI
jgi:hypothetical protein